MTAFIMITFMVVKCFPLSYYIGDLLRDYVKQLLS